MKEQRVRKTVIARVKEPVRLLALSDGLFATVLTLLVLDLRIPEALNTAGGDITTFTRWIGPHLFSYLMTFFVAGNYWLAHHRDFDHITGYDHYLLGYNLLFLLFVGLFPFTTATISTVSAAPGSYATYWAIYAANFILAGIMLLLIRLYAQSHGLIDPGISLNEGRRVLTRQIVAPVVFLISAGLEFLFPRAYLGPWILLALLPLQMVVDRIFANPVPDRSTGLAVWPRRLWQAGITLIWLLIFGIAAWVVTR